MNKNTELVNVANEDSQCEPIRADKSICSQGSNMLADSDQPDLEKQPIIFKNRPQGEHNQIVSGQIDQKNDDNRFGKEDQFVSSNLKYMHDLTYYNMSP